MLQNKRILFVKSTVIFESLNELFNIILPLFLTYLLFSTFADLSLNVS